MRILSKKRQAATEPTEVLISDSPTATAKVEDFLILLYGRPKIGKSELMSKFSGAYFLETEPGLKFLKVRKTVIKRWEDFQGLVIAFEKHGTDKHKVKMFVVDTVDNLYKFCFTYVCTTKGFEHPSDAEWGKGWEATYDEWHHWITRLISLGCGITFVAHQVEREIISRSIQITKTEPALPKTAYRLINAVVDFIFPVVTVAVRNKQDKTFQERRYIITKARENLEAGDRTGLLPARIPLNYEEFYAALQGAVRGKRKEVSE
jgi:hypothetical protein